jgi:hypothetical protein
MGGQLPTKKGKKKAKKGKKSKKVKVEDDLLNTDDLRAGSEPMIDVNLEAPQAQHEKPKKSKKKWSEQTKSELPSRE